MARAKKTGKQQFQETEALRRRVAELEASERVLRETADALKLDCSIHVAELKKSEEKIRAANDALESTVALRTAELKVLKDRLQAENVFLREELEGLHACGDIIGEAPVLKTVIQQIELVAPTDASVLILGESGTGKELVAREIHRRSRRNERPMIKVNCATIPKDLYESEFFGHVKGAFTGAIRDRAGRFEAADGGTLFLDEVGEIPLELQGKLLRVLQEGEYERIGEERLRKVDVRVIAATNQHLKEKVDRKHFREDLFYRLNVFPITVPPLRERKGDIVLLAHHFLQQVANRMNRPKYALSRANVADLTAYDWPGNVRELQNAVERAVILSDSGRLRFDTVGASEDGAAGRRPPVIPADAIAHAVLNETQVVDFVRRNMIAALESCGWKIYGKGGAAQALGINPTTLIARMKRHGLQRVQGP
ncbi:MAG: sigma 54-interacting transcriptional regulator [Pseudomonadota bacterium]